MRVDPSPGITLTSQPPLEVGRTRAFVRRSSCSRPHSDCRGKRVVPGGKEHSADTPQEPPSHIIVNPATKIDVGILCLEHVQVGLRIAVVALNKQNQGEAPKVRSQPLSPKPVTHLSGSFSWALTLKGS